jgi:hypothetical protein
MKSLRFVSLSDDGAHLILSGDPGESYAVPITDELRVAAARRVRQGTSSAVTKLSPREIQTRIRHGASAEDIAAETGLPLDRIESYAAPVRAEREYAASQARGVEVADRTLTRDALRAVFGEEPVTIENMVEHRASLSGIADDSLRWDAWRRADHQWDVRLEFVLDDPSAVEGTDLADADPEALWVFNPLRKTMHNVNRWAQFLSELEPLESAPRERRLTAVDGSAESPGSESAESAPTAPDSSELLDMLSRRRGTRLGSDEESDDKLALMISDSQRAAAARSSQTGSSSGDVTSLPAPLPAAEDDDADPVEEQPRTRNKKSLKDRRSRVPSWDQIYFGTKPDHD